MNKYLISTSINIPKILKCTKIIKIKVIQNTKILILKYIFEIRQSVCDWLTNYYSVVYKTKILIDI